MIARAVLLLFLSLYTVNCTLYTDLYGQEIFTYDAKDKRDPFVPLVTKDGRVVAEKKAIERIEDIMLEGIIWDPKGGSFAMINGEIAAVGDLVGGFKIINIESDSVTLESGGKEYKITRSRE